MRLILHNWNISCVALSSISVRAWRPATLDSNWAHSAAQGQESSGASLDQCQPPASLATEKFEKFNWTQLNPTKFELNWFYDKCSQDIWAQRKIAATSRNLFLLCYHWYLWNEVARRCSPIPKYSTSLTLLLSSLPSLLWSSSIYPHRSIPSRILGEGCTK